MIALIETPNGVEKALIRHQVFHRVDNNNKKLVKDSLVRSQTIKNIFWIKEGKCIKMPFDAWKKEVEEKGILQD